MQHQTLVTSLICIHFSNGFAFETLESRTKCRHGNLGKPTRKSIRRRDPDERN